MSGCLWNIIVQINEDHMQVLICSHVNAYLLTCINMPQWQYTIIIRHGLIITLKTPNSLFLVSSLLCY